MVAAATAGAFRAESVVRGDESPVDLASSVCRDVHV